MNRSELLCAGRFNTCGISIYSTPIAGDLVDMLGCCCLRKSRPCSGFDASVERASKSSALGAPVFAEATARQATQEPPSHMATARQGNQLRFGPACAGKKP